MTDGQIPDGESVHRSDMQAVRRQLAHIRTELAAAETRLAAKEAGVATTADKSTLPLDILERLRSARRQLEQALRELEPDIE